jgi:dipeptidyl aminopeptidase/acylaminoacyl peptidase
LHETTGWISGVRFSRDGKHIAFADHPHIGDNRGYAAVTDLAGNARRLGEIWSSIAGVGWSPDGSEIWFTAGEAGTSRALHAVDLEGTHHAVSRGPVDLVLYDIDANGRALISRTNLSRGIVGKPPGTEEEVTLTWLDWSFLDVLSLDGETVLFTEQGEGGGAGYSSILRSTRGGPAIRMGPGQAMAISPDGTRVMTRLLDGDNPLMIYPTGAGEVETLDTGNVLVSFADWTTDPDRLFVVGVREGTGFRGYLFEPRSGEMEQVITEDLDFISTAYHRDLGLVAARTVDGPLQIFPLDGSEPRAVAVPDPGLAPLGWSRDGRALFVGEYGKVPLVVSRLDLDTGEMKTMWELMPSELAGLIDVGPVLVNPDGTAYAYSYRRDLSILYRADGF